MSRRDKLVVHEPELEVKDEPGLVEVREKVDGTWVISYAEEGWIGSRAQTRPMTTSFWPGATQDDPHDLNAASSHAHYLAAGHEVKVIPLSEQARKAAITKAARK